IKSVVLRIGSSFRGDAGASNLEIPRCAMAHLRSGPLDRPGNDDGDLEDWLMRILQPAEWSKPRGFSHGVEFNGPGRWIVLAGQTGGDEKGDYPPTWQLRSAPRCGGSSSSWRKRAPAPSISYA